MTRTEKLQLAMSKMNDAYKLVSDAMDLAQTEDCKVEQVESDLWNVASEIEHDMQMEEERERDEHWN